MVPGRAKDHDQKGAREEFRFENDYEGDPEIPRAAESGDEDRRAGAKRRHARCRRGDRRQTADRICAAGRVPGKQDVITQWSMNDVEASGLLKMDFLGLRNLTILSRTVKLIEQTTGKQIDPLKFPLDDKETYALLATRRNQGSVPTGIGWHSRLVDANEA